MIVQSKLCPSRARHSCVVFVYISSIVRTFPSSKIVNLMAGVVDVAGAAMEALQRVWDGVGECWHWILHTVGGDFRLLLAFYFWMMFWFASSGVLSWACDRWHLLDRYKLQPQKYPTWEDYKQCLKNVALNYGLVIFPLLFLAHPVLQHLQFSRDMPDFFTFCWTFSFCVVSEDVTHYFLHRALHTPFLYKHIHKVHHTYTAPFGITGTCCCVPTLTAFSGLCTPCGNGDPWHCNLLWTAVASASLVYVLLVGVIPSNRRPARSLGLRHTHSNALDSLLWWCTQPRLPSQELHLQLQQSLHFHGQIARHLRRS